MFSFPIYAQVFLAVFCFCWLWTCFSYFLTKIYLIFLHFNDLILFSHWFLAKQALPRQRVKAQNSVRLLSDYTRYTLTYSGAVCACVCFFVVIFLPTLHVFSFSWRTAGVAMPTGHPMTQLSQSDNRERRDQTNRFLSDWLECLVQNALIAGCFAGH